MDHLEPVRPMRLYPLEHPAELPEVRAIRRKPAQEAQLPAQQTRSLLAEQCAALVLQCATPRKLAMVQRAPAPLMH